MQEHELSNRDYREIWDLAHREWLSIREKDEHLLLCKAYTRALATWLSSKKLAIINGKIVYNETPKAASQEDKEL